MNRQPHPSPNFRFLTLLTILGSAGLLTLSSCSNFRSHSEDEEKDPRLGHYFGGQGYGPKATRYVPPAAAHPGSDIPPVKGQ